MGVPAPARPATALGRGDIAALLLVISTTAFGHAVMWGQVTFDTGGFRFVAVATTALLVALFFLGGQVTSQTYAVIGAAVGIALMMQFLAFLSVPPVFYPTPGTDRSPYHFGQTLMVLGIVACALSFIRTNPYLRIARNALLYGGFLITGLWVLTLSPDPGIDVFRLHRQAATDLLAGTSPYALSQPVGDTYMGWKSWTAYPYPPIALLVQLPAHVLFHDTRWTNLFAMAATAFMVSRIARTAGLPRNICDIIGALVLLQPRTFFILEQGWIDPISAALLVGAVHAYVSDRLTLASVLFGLAAVSKQYMIVLAPLILFLPKFHKKQILIAAAAATATLLPFLLWNAQGFWHGVVESQLDTPNRLRDSNSIAAYLFRRHQIELPPWFGFTAWITVPLAATYWRRTIPMVPVIAFTVGLALLFNFGKQGFSNYYWLMSALAGLTLSLLPLYANRQAEPWIFASLRRPNPRPDTAETPISRPLE